MKKLWVRLCEWLFSLIGKLGFSSSYTKGEEAAIESDERKAVRQEPQEQRTQSVQSVEPIRIVLRFMSLVLGYDVQSIEIPEVTKVGRIEYGCEEVVCLSGISLPISTTLHIVLCSEGHEIVVEKAIDLYGSTTLAITPKYLGLKPIIFDASVLEHEERTSYQ